ncbi:helix-turn-helix domain-containing protein [Maribacter litoralis]|jgi:AraC-like DNA-binding protein|uniref:helix-turn-helix domain-containing protein n=1 Tax=Maribacter litoralis TaxID=2059726 RepID=UPI000E30B4C2|nr:helix-turn-helix domain-containing protein [Maribacter litoralis]
MQDTDDFRVKRINQMLLEMAKGNFFYSLEPSDKNDNLASLMVMINMVKEEIQASFIHQGFVSTDRTPQFLIQMSLIIDENGIVEMANQKACGILLRMRNAILGSPFTDLLTESSQKKWNKKMKTFLKRKHLDTSIKLSFKTKEGLLISKNCTVTNFRTLDGNSSKIIVNTVLFSNAEPDVKGLWKNAVEPGKESKRRKIRLSHGDIQKIRNVHDMILNNLESDPPHLKDLALQMGTNEFKLKYGFKELYGTTVFKFLIQERLRKAKTLIKYTSKSLKTIAHMVGFKSIPHFSRAFKEKYGRTPSSLRS